MSKEVVKKPENSLIEELPSYLVDAIGEQIVGFEASKNDVEMPYIRLINKTDDPLLKGHVGRMIDSIKQTFYPPEIFITSTFFFKVFMVNKNYKKGGNFGGSFPDLATAQALVDEIHSKTGIQRDWEVKEMHNHVCIVSEDEEGRRIKPAILSLSGNPSLKTSRIINATIAELASIGDKKLPRYSVLFKLSSAPTVGTPYYHMVAKPAGSYTPAKMFAMAAELYEKFQYYKINPSTKTADEILEA